MKTTVLLAIVAVVNMTLTFTGIVSAQERPFKQMTHRQVAVTFDDLPVATPSIYNIEEQRAIVSKLVKSITSNNIPAIGFVNESKLYKFGEVDARIALLKTWLDAGLELGNHTFSHLPLQTTPLAEYEENVMRGETVAARLLNEKGMKLRYFRHPVLQVGPNLEVRRNFERFLAERGYTIAPVTIDNGDYIFAAAYAKAERCGDKESMRRVIEAYLPYYNLLCAVSARLCLHTVTKLVKSACATANAPSNKSLDVRAKQRLSYLACLFPSRCVVAVSPHVISIVIKSRKARAILFARAFLLSF
jgi:peptidoglycan/xylan/chitin deacetylase (PgdA/CDA1 family)